MYPLNDRESYTKTCIEKEILRMQNHIKKYEEIILIEKENTDNPKSLKLIEALQETIKNDEDLIKIMRDMLSE